MNDDTKGIIVQAGVMSLIFSIGLRIVDMALNGYTEEKRLDALDMADEIINTIESHLRG